MHDKYMAKSLKRKRELEQREVEAPSRPVLTNAEKMRQYRLRKKLKKANTAARAVPEPVVGLIPDQRIMSAETEINPEPVASILPEPVPGRSIDPVIFENFSQQTVSFHGK